jgi:hypothetical protein
MRHVVVVTLLLASLIHLAPLLGVLGPARLVQAYGIARPEPNLEILLRHRAVLFGIVGAFMAYAAFVPAYQATGFAVGLVSAVSFLVIAHGVGAMNASMAKIAVMDVVAVALLGVGGVASFLARRA